MLLECSSVLDLTDHNAVFYIRHVLCGADITDINFLHPVVVVTKCIESRHAVTHKVPSKTKNY